jgi:dihydrofolate synthase/folylpolyglutamate synthase
MPQDLLARLTRLHPKLIDLSLDRMRVLLAALDHPERRLPPVIHIAGTNGKGSTVAMLGAIFRAAGLAAHAYTSPHLVRFNERIALRGTPIGDAALEAILERVEAANAERPITFFEVTTAAAFVAFAETPADVLLLEVGLGGEFDATNVIDHPILTAITPVDLDHTEFLGPDIATIAVAKAGILKPGVPAVIGRQTPEGLATIERIAAEVGAPLQVCGRDWVAERVPEGVRVAGLHLPHPGLTGEHQYDNAAMAAVCALTLPMFPAITPEAIRQGIANAHWPGRLQRLTAGPLPALLPPGIELWLDGMHNNHGARAIAETLAEWRVPTLGLVLGLKANRDPATILAPLAPHVSAIATVTVPGEPNVHSAETLAAAARAYRPAAPCATLEAAIRYLLQHGATRILIGGSLYLAGAVLAENS